MPNGRQGDHPLTDIIVYNLEIYGKEADGLIRKISQLSSSRELEEWWQREIGWNPKPSEILPRARRQYEELVKRAENSGWEV